MVGKPTGSAAARVVFHPDLHPTGSHQQVIYNLLFLASAAATKKLAIDPRLMGGKIGMMGVLHTWG